jgi:hypothetical protein
MLSSDTSWSHSIRHFQFISGQTPLAAWHEPVLTCVFYLAVVFGLKAVMERRKAFELKLPVVAFNFFLAFASGVLCCFLTSELWRIFQQPKGAAILFCDPEVKNVGGTLYALYYINYIYKVSSRQHRALAAARIGARATILSSRVTAIYVGCSSVAVCGAAGHCLSVPTQEADSIHPRLPSCDYAFFRLDSAACRNLHPMGRDGNEPRHSRHSILLETNLSSEASLRMLKLILSLTSSSLIALAVFQPTTLSMNLATARGGRAISLPSRSHSS